MIRVEKKTPTDALRSINKARKAKKIREVQKDGVHRYVRGETHKLGALEKEVASGACLPRMFVNWTV